MENRIAELTSNNSQSALIEMAIALHAELGTDAPAYKHMSKTKIAEAIIALEREIDDLRIINEVEGQTEWINAQPAPIEDLIVEGKSTTSTVSNMKSLRAKIRKIVDAAISQEGTVIWTALNSTIDLSTHFSDGTTTFSVTANLADGTQSDEFATTDQRQLYRHLGALLNFEAPATDEPTAE